MLLDGSPHIMCVEANCNLQEVRQGKQGLVDCLLLKYFDNPVPFFFTSLINEFFCETLKLIIIDFEIHVNLIGLIS